MNDWTFRDMMERYLQGRLGPDAECEFLEMVEENPDYHEALCEARDVDAFLEDLCPPEKPSHSALQLTDAIFSQVEVQKERERCSLLEKVMGLVQSRSHDEMDDAAAVAYVGDEAEPNHADEVVADFLLAYDAPEPNADLAAQTYKVLLAAAINPAPMWLARLQDFGSLLRRLAASPRRLASVAAVAAVLSFLGISGISYDQERFETQVALPAGAPILTSSVTANANVLPERSRLPELAAAIEQRRASRRLRAADYDLLREAMSDLASSTLLQTTHDRVRVQYILGQ